MLIGYGMQIHTVKGRQHSFMVTSRVAGSWQFAIHSLGRCGELSIGTLMGKLKKQLLNDFIPFVNEISLILLL
jgi:hypothetical protein